MASPLSLYQPLALFVPNSAGDSSTLLDLTLQAVDQTFPFLSRLLDVVGRPKPSIVNIEDVAVDADAKAAAAALKALFDRFGSDKSTGRDYHHLYGEILKRRDDVSCVVEIGLGTNDPDVVSNMGATGQPGASLRAFHEYLPKATIIGADIDRAVLFQDGRIRTYFVDQTDLASLDALAAHLPDAVDLIIDDGLHAPNANVAVLAFGLNRLKDGGWLVVEDIPERAIPLWEVVAALLPDRFESRLLRARGALAFVVRRRGAAT